MEARSVRPDPSASSSTQRQCIGLDPNTGGGKRGDGKRVKEQTRRLFSASISFIQNVEFGGLEREHRLNMNVASASELWWDPKRPDQINLWDSWVELGERFYEALTTSPIPLDIRALRALKRSPLALDLYAWSTHKAFTVSRKGQSQYIPWKSLGQQFGGDYSNHLDFKKKAKDAFRKILLVYPGLKLSDDTPGGITVCRAVVRQLQRSPQRERLSSRDNTSDGETVPPCAKSVWI